MRSNVKLNAYLLSIYFPIIKVKDGRDYFKALPGKKVKKLPKLRKYTISNPFSVSETEGSYLTLSWISSTLKNKIQTGF